jgi:hypothetical protein
LVSGHAQTFTVSDDGNGTTGTLIVAGCCDPQIVLANDTCSGNPLAAGGTCSFDLTFTAPSGCSSGPLYVGPLDVIGANPFAGYIHLEADQMCP